MASLRLGIIGAGRHGSRYAHHAAKDLEGLRLSAICRRDRRSGGALAAELGCDFTGDAFELIAREDVDAVALVTVPDLLEGFIEAVAGHGKALLVEKPVAQDLASALRIADIIDKSGIYCLAGHTLRFNAVCKRIREHIAELGRIDSLSFSQAFPPQLQLAWLDRPERSGGGNILHTGVHCFDLINFFTGMVPGTAFCRARSIYTRRTEDCFSAEFTFEDSQALAHVTCARTTSSRNGLMEIVGEHGQLVGDHVHNTLYRIGKGGREQLDPGDPQMTVLEALRCLRDEVAEGRSPSIKYRDGLAAVAVADACYRSVKSERPEKVVLPY